MAGRVTGTGARRMRGAIGAAALGLWVGGVACDGHDDPTATATTVPPPVPHRVQVTVSRNPNMVLERRFAIELPPSVLAADLRCTSEAEPLEDHRLSFTGTVGELRLYGLLPALAYQCTLSSTSGTPLWSGSFVTDPLPEGFPVLVPSGDRTRASSDDGYTLFTHWKLGNDYEAVQRLIVVDGDGRVRWYVDVLDARTGGLAGTLLPDGRVITGGGQSSPPAIRDLSGDIQFQVPLAVEPDPGYHHEALLTDAGWLVSLQSVANTAPGAPMFSGFRIEAWDPATGQLVWKFDTQPSVDAGILPPGQTGDLDPYHANAITWADDDPAGPSVWVSLRGLGKLIRIDQATAQIVDDFGPQLGIDLVDTNGDPLPIQRWFWGQHAPEFDGDTVLVYDNGGRRPGGGTRGFYSRAAKYRRVDATTAELVWDWSELGWYETNFGSVVTMPNGHVLIGTGHCGDCVPIGDVAWIVELDPVAGDPVWRFDFSGDRDSLYRAQPIDGCAPFANARFCPALAAR